MNKLVILFLHLFFFHLSQSRLLEQWKKISISRSRISSKSIKETLPLGTLKLASGKCSCSQWCRLFCLPFDSSQPWILSDLYVSGGFIETNSDQILSCYTKYSKEMVYGKTFYAVPNTKPNFPNDRILNGIYDPNNSVDSQCALYSATSFTLIIDLFEIKTIRKITIIGDNFINNKIYVGESNKVFFKATEQYLVDNYKETIFTIDSVIQGRFVKFSADTNLVNVAICVFFIE